WPLYFALFLALWSAIVGGTFSAFSEFIMSALKKTAPVGGIEAMQNINRDVIKTQFVAGILSIAAFSAIFAVYSLLVFEGEALVTLVLASLVYLASVFLVTMFGNVPMNNALAQFEHDSLDARVYWEKYTRTWTQLNHARSFGSIVTSGLYIIAAITLITSGQV
ncbi:MAG: anthrone oxygenase family protein, partial [Pseudomonadota bacterium]